MKNIIKELLVSFIITIVLIFLLSVAVYSTELNENYIDSITIGIVCLSLLIAGARLAKSKKEKGIVYGSLLGIVYMVVLYIISSLCNMDFSVTINSIFMIILGVLGGAIGGILGVNFLK